MSITLFCCVFVSGMCPLVVIRPCHVNEAQQGWNSYYRLPHCPGDKVVRVYTAMAIPRGWCKISPYFLINLDLVVLNFLCACLLFNSLLTFFSVFFFFKSQSFVCKQCNVQINPSPSDHFAVEREDITLVSIFKTLLIQTKRQLDTKSTV